MLSLPFSKKFLLLLPLAIALWGAWFFQPERQVLRRHRQLLHAVERRDWARVSALLDERFRTGGAGRADAVGTVSGGMDKARTLETGREALQPFLFLQLTEGEGSPKSAHGKGARNSQRGSQRAARQDSASGTAASEPGREPASPRSAARWPQVVAVPADDSGGNGGDANNGNNGIPRNSSDGSANSDGGERRNGGSARLRVRTLLRMEGSGVAWADEAVAVVNRSGEPFEFEWRRASWKPWDWRLVRADHPLLRRAGEGWE